MEKSVGLNLVAKLLSEGTIGEKLCRICLMPLTSGYENIFSKICKLDEEYCIADILGQLCDIQFSDRDHYCVCRDCFTAASNAYQFYLKAKNTEKILSNITDSLYYGLDDIVISENNSKQSLLITLPGHDTADKAVKSEYGVNNQAQFVLLNHNSNSGHVKIDQQMRDIKMEIKMEKYDITDKQDDDDLVVIMSPTGQPMFLKMLPNGMFVEIEADDQCRNAYKLIKEKQSRRPRHQGPMSWKGCTQCPVKYRYVAKLTNHMLLEHQIVLYVCKICKALCEGIDDYKFHMGTHSKDYACDKCGTTFKNRNYIISHLLLHENIKDTNQDCVCKVCGFISTDLEVLNTHVAMHTEKPFTCYYCGRTYKKEKGFNNHIRKHELYLKKKESMKEQIYATKVKAESKSKQKRDYTCAVCGKGFLGQRALDWHGRLHTNERPFECDVCGKGFISLNRRNQHKMCAHTVPTRRCPLCPALFHMRSMVNTHIKKVHLNMHKRRRRAVRAGEVSWHTEPVPMQELSVAVQHDILDLDLKPSL